MDTDNHLYLTEKRASERLQISRSWLRKRRTHGGGPPFIRLGRRLVRYAVEDLDAWMEAKSVNPTIDSGDGRR